ncbi:3-deoxy-manno-octulosonate cytidylyltransferase [Solemya elarraichensis gill symbiont]|uniref:3-deoxy-manno-octulosonate cytidylyltransferase n=1 Tax=Solemya elarraichensis gill symbiont TaxID=1918949 RepID=A0A1T2KVZ8_9GAMM|nr:3-deoxy-manno-octulosonate cytidylyltransferase [Solemya elarraichensis gill symbiont]OOZ37015.1 3-deoxy-manno-octulosonate cytidylyltransferase [Solemya elarraichensis gill symbiont]
MSQFTVVIPARYASTRLPGKPLLEIAGRPMISHVVERALDSGASNVIVATDDQRIADVVSGLDVDVCMTRADHPSGTDRLAEVAEQQGWYDEQMIINLQGDEPQMPATLLTQVFEALDAHPQAAIATLCTPISDAEELFDPNAVKVVMDSEGYAHYFSRAVIPWQRDWFAQHGTHTLPEGVNYYRHLGIYAYRAGFLKKYAGLSPAPTEEAESLEQLRALWHGEKIHVSVADEVPPAGIDTEADLNRVRRLWASS